MGFSHMYPMLVYTGMCHRQCVFLAILFVIIGGSCFGPGFDGTYMSYIIIGILCMFFAQLYATQYIILYV